MSGLRLFTRRTVWVPTILGWLILAAFACIPAGAWWFYGESFLSQTYRLQAQVLVVEGWVGSDAIDYAKLEFERGGYEYIVTTSGLTGDRWDKVRWSYAVMAQEKLLKEGIPTDRIIIAAPPDTDTQRTFQSAAAVWRALRERGIRPAAINVLTFGPHARRSRITFARVFEPETKVGVISYVPPGYTAAPWWRSSDRSSELLRETVGCAYEALFDSGRASNSPLRAAR